MDERVLENHFQLHLIAYRERKDRERQDNQIYDYIDLGLKTALRFCAGSFDVETWNPLNRSI